MKNQPPYILKPFSHVVFFVSTLIFLSPVQAQYIWDNDNGDGDWSNPINWDVSGSDPGTAPTIADDVELSQGGSLVGTPVEINASAFAASIYLTRTAASSYLEINADLDVAGSFTLAYDSRVLEGVVNHESGTVSVGTDLVLAERDGNSTYNMNGGTLDVTGKIFLGRGNDTTQLAQFIQNGGVVTAGEIGGGSFGGSDNTLEYLMNAGSLTVANSSQLSHKSKSVHFTQSGGTAIFSSALRFADDSTSATGHGVGTFSDAADTTIVGQLVIGSASASNGEGTLRLDGSISGAGTDVQADGGILFDVNSHFEAVIDDAAILAAGDMRLMDVTGTMEFAAGSLLNPMFDAGSTPTAGTWTLATFDTLVDGGLSLDPSVDSGWSFDLDANALTVSYVPEPTSLVLVLISFFGLMIFRRKI